jgi:hypothetical protein
MDCHTSGLEVVKILLLKHFSTTTYFHRNKQQEATAVMPLL